MVFTKSGNYKTDNMFFSHTIIDRSKVEDGINEINSEWYYFFNNIFNRFCEVNKIKYKRFLRMNLNLTYHHDSEYYSLPHVDHDISHKTAIINLNEAEGKTIMYDKTFRPKTNDDTWTKEKIKVVKEIPPELGKIISFDGFIFHSIRPPPINTYRIICVMTYEQ